MSRQTREELSGGMLQWLKGFCLTARTGSLSGAARELGCRQPAISYQIRQLEAELGVRLFRKKGSVLQLTEAGRTVLEKADDIFGMLRELRHELAPEGEPVGGEVTVVTTLAVALYYLSPRLEVFTRRFPMVRMRIEVRGFGAMCEQIMNGSADCAILSGASLPRGVQAEELFEAGLVLVAPRDHEPRLSASPALEELADVPFVALAGDGTVTPHLAPALEARDIRLNVAHVADNVVLAKALVTRGLGVGVMDDFVVSPEDAVHVYSLSAYCPARRFRLITRRRRMPSRQAAAFMDFLREGRNGAE